MYKKIISILNLLLLCLSVYSQPDKETENKAKLIEISFDQGSYAVDRALRENEKSITDFIYSVDLVKRDTASVIQMIEVNSYTSPEGGKTLNNKLSQNRSEAISTFLESECGLSNDLIVVRSHGIWWEGLRELVVKSDMEHKDEVLTIIDNTDEETWGKVNPTDTWTSMVDSRGKQLMELRAGAPYAYMYNNLFPLMRKSTIRAAYFTNEPEPQEVFLVAKSEPQPTPEPTPQPTPEPVLEPQPEPILEPEPVVSYIEKPMFAIKTNLLFDALTVLNIEFEIPIKKKFSLAAEWIFPWWTNRDYDSADSARNTLQLLNGNIEAKYWFGDRTERPVMTGWFAGLYAGGGLYDLEYDGIGYQGEFFIASGLSAGYAHTINKKGNLRAEYTLGVGYLKTNYRYYESQYSSYDGWHPFKERLGNYTWLGPTKIRASLVWMINNKKEEGGVR